MTGPPAASCRWAALQRSAIRYHARGAVGPSRPYKRSPATTREADVRSCSHADQSLKGSAARRRDPAPALRCRRRHPNRHQRAAVTSACPVLERACVCPAAAMSRTCGLSFPLSECRALPSHRRLHHHSKMAGESEPWSAAVLRQGSRNCSALSALCFAGYAGETLCAFGVAGIKAGHSQRTRIRR